MKVNKVNNKIHPTYYGWTSEQDGLLKTLQAAETMIENLEWYGEECGDDIRILKRMYKGKCIDHGCKMGYYRAPAENGFVCERRVDELAKESETLQSSHISITVFVCVLSAFLLVVIFCYLMRR